MNENAAVGRIAIVAAMNREISGLVLGWQRRNLRFAGSAFRAFEEPHAVAIATGIGMRTARLASQAIVKNYRPKLLISAGIAGSIAPSVRVGQVRRFGEVIELETQYRYKAAAGDGVLATAPSVLGAEEKRALAAQHGAVAVDMEAAGVAAVAAANHIPFLAIKAISDELDSPLPPLNRFIRADGSFATGAFILHTALRPREWRATIALARNTRRSIAALETALRDLIDNQEAVAAAIKSNTGANRST